LTAPVLSTSDLDLWKAFAFVIWLHQLPDSLSLIRDHLLSQTINLSLLL
jgi:hypothetical protein